MSKRTIMCKVKISCNSKSMDILLYKYPNKNITKIILIGQKNRNKKYVS